MPEKQHLLTLLHVRLVTAFAVITLLGACATHVTLSGADRASLHQIYIDQEVKVPDAPTYYGAGDIWSQSVGGIFGALLSDSMTTKEQMLLEALETGGIDVAEMSRESLARQLGEADIFDVVEVKGSDGILTLSVEFYGLFIQPRLSGLKPAVLLKAVLKNAAGDVVWEHQDGFRGGHESVESKDFEEWLTDPDALKTGFQKTVDASVAKLIADLNS